MISIKTIHTAFNTLRANFTALEQQLLDMGFSIDSNDDLVDPGVYPPQHEILAPVLIREYHVLREAIDDFARMISIQRLHEANPQYGFTRSQLDVVHSVVAKELAGNVLSGDVLRPVLDVVVNQLKLPDHFFSKG